MRADQLLRDYSISYAQQGHKHCTSGWLNVHCPFCPGSQDYHMGIREELNAAHCWRCGGHSVVTTLSKVLNLPKHEVIRILKEYGGNTVDRRKITAPRVAINPFKFPQPFQKLDKIGKHYLAKRGFDPEKLEHEWDLLQTGPVSVLDNIQYGKRIIIPIYWNGKLVSFQARDFTDRHDLKYLACPMKREVIHHKNILYERFSLQTIQQSVIIIVEGVIDVWRLGPAAVATFGTAFKMEQVLALSKMHDRFVILYDNEPQAQEQAHKLSIKLRSLGKVVHIETVEDDPGSMSDEDAKHLVKQLTRKDY